MNYNKEIKKLKVICNKNNTKKCKKNLEVLNINCIHTKLHNATYDCATKCTTCGIGITRVKCKVKIA